MIKKENERYVLLDIETTGLNPEQETIIEVAAIKVEDGEIVDRFNELMNPGREVSDIITKITGITNDMLEVARPIDEVMLDFIRFIGDYDIVGHNIVRFDMRFINNYLLREYGRALPNRLIDTLAISRNTLWEVPNHKLGTLAEYFGISYNGAHRALRDVEINNDVYIKLKEMQKKNIKR